MCSAWVILPFSTFRRNASIVGLPPSWSTAMPPTCCRVTSGTMILKAVGPPVAVFQSPSPGFSRLTFSTKMTWAARGALAGSCATTAARYLSVIPIRQARSQLEALASVVRARRPSPAAAAASAVRTILLGILVPPLAADLDGAVRPLTEQVEVEIGVRLNSRRGDGAL